MAATKTETSFVDVEYPKEGEEITSPTYTFHIEVDEQARDQISRMEVRIDRGGPQQCREAVGAYWFDWSGYGPGAHQIVAMATTCEGKTLPAAIRRFSVRLEPR